MPKIKELEISMVEHCDFCHNPSKGFYFKTDRMMQRILFYCCGDCAEKIIAPIYNKSHEEPLEVYQD